MRTLSSTLEAGQKVPNVKPLVKVVLTKGATTYTYTKTRILDVPYTEQGYSNVAEILLDNSDGSLTNINLQGFKAVLSSGVTAGAGDEYSAKPPMWVIAQRYDSPRRKVCSLTVVGALNLMSGDKASDDYTPDSSNTDSLKTILQAVAGATLAPFTHCLAYTITFDSPEEGLLTTFIPKDAFRVYLNETRTQIIKRLLNYVRSRAIWKHDEEIHILQPTTIGGTYAYEYKLNVSEEHNLWEEGYRRRVVIPGVMSVASHPDHDTIYSGAATADDYAGYATAVQFTGFRRLRLASNAQATAIAGAMVANAQLSAEKGHIKVPINVGQELYDYVKITDSVLGANRVGNVSFFREHYKAGGDRVGKWEMEVRFGAVGVGQYLGGLPPQFGLAGDDIPSYQDLLDLEELMRENLLALALEIKEEIQQIEPAQDEDITWVTVFDGSVDTPTSKTWSVEAGIPFTKTGSVYFSPVIEEVPGIYVVYVIDEGANFWKYNITTKEWQELTSPAKTATGEYRTLAINPLGSKLACPSGDATKYIEIYDIGTDTWTTSSAVPTGNFANAKAKSLVWADNDTIWAWLQNGGIKDGECAKYVVSGDTWTEYTNSTGVVAAWTARGAAINAAGTIVYGGAIGAANEICKYTIATDGYAYITKTDYIPVSAYDKDKLWYFYTVTEKWGYIDTADDSATDVFDVNPDLVGGGGVRVGVDDAGTYMISWNKDTAPEIMSAIAGGTYLLGTVHADGWSPVIIEMPDWNYTMLVVDTSNNKTYSYDHSIQIWISEGTWEFYITQAIPSYADILIVRGVF